MDAKAIIDGLKGIQGVKGVSVIKSDGTVLDSHEFLDADNAILGFSGTAINDAANMFTLGNARRSVIQGPGYKILIVIDHDHYIGTIMDEDVDEEMIEQKIENLVSTAG